MGIIYNILLLQSTWRQNRGERVQNKNNQIVRVIDSHTGGEPTRVIIAGSPDLGSGTLSEKLAVFRDRYDWFRSAVVNEPRGSDVLVGAMLCPPSVPENAAATIFFNNVGYLGMCGHGSIGLAVTLAHLGKLDVGEHRLETPAGDVALTLHDQNKVTVSNVRSYRFRHGISLQVPDIGTVTGDVAWGGNWFFLISDHDQDLSYDNVDVLTNYCWAVRNELDGQGITGADGENVDHVELFGPPTDSAKADGKNFVLCPGKAYDRSPCGTGTSAKVACLIEDGKLEPGAMWRQESITGSIFEAHAKVTEDGIYPVITGTAFITGEASLLFHPDDPFRNGLFPG